jgi:hypothetical protein
MIACGCRILTTLMPLRGHVGSLQQGTSQWWRTSNGMKTGTCMDRSSERGRKLELVCFRETDIEARLRNTGKSQADCKQT